MTGDYDFPYSYDDFVKEDVDCVAKTPTLVYSTRRVRTPYYSYPLHYHYANYNPTQNYEQNQEQALCAFPTATVPELASTSY